MRNKTRLTSCLIVAGVVVIAVACSDDDDDDDDVTSATATFMGINGQTVTGTGKLKKGSDGKVTLVVTITAAPPGTHGIHIHDVPSCDDEGMAAGSHWDDDDTSPENHHLPPGNGHLGDLGNISIAADGTGTLTSSNPAWTLGDGAATDVLPHAIIFHQMMDDGTVPSSGARWGCALIVAD